MSCERSVSGIEPHLASAAAQSAKCLIVEVQRDELVVGWRDGSSPGLDVCAQCLIPLAAPDEVNLVGNTVVS